MSVIEKRGSIRSEAVYSDDYAHRFILRKEWDREKKRAVIIMIHPNTNDPFEIDVTTMRIVNNLNRLKYGYCDITNLYSLVLPGKLKSKDYSNDLLHESNDGYIMRAVQRADSVILAWGSAEETSKQISKRVSELMERLEPYKDKMYIITDKHTNVARHPLASSVANQWNLVKVFNHNN